MIKIDKFTVVMENIRDSGNPFPPNCVNINMYGADGQLYYVLKGMYIEEGRVTTKRLSQLFAYAREARYSESTLEAGLNKLAKNKALIIRGDTYTPTLAMLDAIRGNTLFGCEKVVKSAILTVQEAIQQFSRR